MRPEIEVSFWNVDHGELRRRLRAANATCEQPMRLMRRAVIDYPDNRMRRKHPDHWSWVRVRDEGNHVVVTYKRISKQASHDMHEIEFEVSSYENAIALFEAIGLKKQSEQYTRRETWKLHDCEVALDEWPWLEPLAEVEGPTKGAVQQVAELLGFDWSQAQRGNADNAYRVKYPGMRENESVGDIPELTFDELPEWLKERQAA